MADAVDAGTVSFSEALEWHFRQNRNPALPMELIGVAKKAIVFAEHDAWDAEILMPHGWQFEGKPVITVGQAVEVFHLSAFVRRGAAVAVAA